MPWNWNCSLQIGAEGIQSPNVIETSLISLIYQNHICFLISDMSLMTLRQHVGPDVTAQSLLTVLYRGWIAVMSCWQLSPSTIRWMESLHRIQKSVTRFAFELGSWEHVMPIHWLIQCKLCAVVHYVNFGRCPFVRQTLSTTPHLSRLSVEEWLLRFTFPHEFGERVFMSASQAACNALPKLTMSSWKKIFWKLVRFIWRFIAADRLWTRLLCMYSCCSRITINWCLSYDMTWSVMMMHAAWTYGRTSFRFLNRPTEINQMHKVKVKVIFWFIWRLK